MKIKVGDKLPLSEFFYLDENNNVKKINSSSLFKDQKAILIGVPELSQKFVPQNIYLALFLILKSKKKGVTKIICVSVNDPNVMKAWGDSNVNGKIFMAADPNCDFIKLIGADVDKSKKGLGTRSSRFTMFIDNEEVKIIKEENETGICEISAAENFLENL